MGSSGGQSRKNQGGKSRRKKRKNKRRKKKKKNKPKKKRAMEVKKVAKKWEIWIRRRKQKNLKKKLVFQRFYK